MRNYSDMLNRLRLRNRMPVGPFSPESFPGMENPQPQMPSLPVQTFGSQQENEFTPEMQAQNRFNELASQRPVQERPSFIRTLLSGVLGRDTQGIQSLMNAPYNQKLEEFNAKLGPAQRSAEMERQSNILGRDTHFKEREADRRFTFDKNRAEMSDKQFDLSVRKQGETERSSQAREMHQRNMFSLERFKAENPEWKINTDSDEVMLVNARTGDTKRTGIMTGNLSDIDRLNIEQKNRLGVVEATGKTNIDLEKERQGGRLELEGKRQAGEVESINLREALGGKEETAANEQKRYLVNAERLIREDPVLGKFIKLDPNIEGGFKIQESTGGFLGSGFGSKTGPTPEQRKKINDFIKDTGAKGRTVTSGSSKVVKTAPKAPAGWKYVWNEEEKKWKAEPDSTNKGGA